MYQISPMWIRGLDWRLGSLIRSWLVATLVWCIFGGADRWCAWRSRPILFSNRIICILLIDSAESQGYKNFLEFRGLRGLNQAKMITICQKVFDSTFLACPRVLCFNFQIFVLGNQIIAEDPFSTLLAPKASTLGFSHHFYSDFVKRQTKLSMFRVIELNFGFP